MDGDATVETSAAPPSVAGPARDPLAVAARFAALGRRPGGGLEVTRGDPVSKARAEATGNFARAAFLSGGLSPATGASDETGQRFSGAAPSGDAGLDGP